MHKVSRWLQQRLLGYDYFNFTSQVCIVGGFDEVVRERLLHVLCYQVRLHAVHLVVVPKQVPNQALYRHVT